MSLEEETTEVEDEKSLVAQEIKMIAWDLLFGKTPGDMEGMLAEISIVDILARHHGWSDARVREVYEISMIHENSQWDVIVRPKDA